MERMSMSTTTETTSIDPDILITKPGELHVIKRDGRVTNYDANRIESALKSAFVDVKGAEAAKSSSIKEMTEKLTQFISEKLQKRWPDGGYVHIEAIQDTVELALMHEGLHKVAREYVIYRETRRKERESLQAQQQETAGRIIHTVLDDGSKQLLDIKWLKSMIDSACRHLDNVSAEPIFDDVLNNLFDGVAIKDVFKALTMSARTLVEQDPNYSYVTARLLLQNIYSDALHYLDIKHDLKTQPMQELYPKAFATYIQKGIELELLDEKLIDFDLDKLGNALVAERDFQHTYQSVQILHDRYFQHHNDVRIELPQVFFMRVAMGLALGEEPTQRNDRAIEFYNLLSEHDFMCSTPTLFNSGTRYSQLSSCFLTTVPDDLSGIYSAIRDNALLSKYAGGLGNDWTPVRAMGAHIKGTNGKSLGVVPFLNVADATAVAVNQGGKRKGAVCAYLETWHLDIEEFLELRKNTGDDRRRTHDMNTANWIPDLLVKRVFSKEDWTLFSPNDVPDLHDLYGEAFEKRYAEYEKLAAENKIQHKKIPATTLWRKMLSLIFETGHPWFTFKDPCNIRSPQQHCGVVHSSNLCTEITLNTSEDEVAVCNLGSINLAKHTTKDGIDQKKLAATIKTAIRMLDNVVDINYYTIPQARNANLRHRPIGLGIMGFQDALYTQNIDYCSNDAVTFADNSMEFVSYYTIKASMELAKERGKYESFDGSLWSQGILPIDSIALLAKSRGQYLEQDTSSTLDWKTLRNDIKKHGMRNSNTMAIAPTATISNICGVSQSIEPTYQNLFVKSNMSGEFTVVNPFMVRDLKALGLWDQAMVYDLKYYDGSLSKIERVPENIKKRYATAFEIEPKWLIECASRRQKWIDQAQSLNIYMAQPSGKKLDILYRMAWLRGLKTTYYLRTLGATDTEKSTIHTGTLNAVKNNDTTVGSAAPKACSLDDPDCEACQ